jgi:hypothetical protein
MKTDTADTTDTATEMYDYTTHGDFCEYYDPKYKRLYWVLGYASNISITELYELAKKYAAATGCDINTVKESTIHGSRRFNSFKYVYSTQEIERSQVPPTVKEKNIFENVWKWLTD